MNNIEILIFENLPPCIIILDNKQYQNVKHVKYLIYIHFQNHCFYYCTSIWFAYVYMTKLCMHISYLVTGVPFRNIAHHNMVDLVLLYREFCCYNHTLTCSIWETILIKLSLDFKLIWHVNEVVAKCRSS